jgi:hypothetical protein
MPNASNGLASHLNPAANAPVTGRRDCTGIPLSIGDTVEFLDAGQMKILAFEGQDRFVYEENGARRTFPCVAVILLGV